MTASIHDILLTHQRILSRLFSIGIIVVIFGYLGLGISHAGIYIQKEGQATGECSQGIPGSISSHRIVRRAIIGLCQPTEASVVMKCSRQSKTHRQSSREKGIYMSQPLMRGNQLEDIGCSPMSSGRCFLSGASRLPRFISRK